MKVLVVGSGGREHALVWKIAQSSRLSKLYCSPSNGGISKISETVDISATDIDGLIWFAKENRIDLTVVGPEAPLADGIVNRFEKEGLRIFGPGYYAARLESSKIFSKRIMERFSIPTARAHIFEYHEMAKEYLKKTKMPVAVKADGLCAGKGVRIADNWQDAYDFVHDLMVNRIFGDAGKAVIIEECLQGDEVSFMAITDGKYFIPLATSQDHKRLLDNDEGPNTGGMGAYSPAPIMDERLCANVMDKIICPLIECLRKKEKIIYKGVIYAGLMLTEEGPKVLEFNVRFGDPEIQVVLPRLKTDLLDIIEACINDELNRVEVDWDSKSCVAVVIASKGYPDKYEIGKEISGLEEVERLEDILVFHAGTKLDEGRFITSGGRVLNVVASAPEIEEAIKRAYSSVDRIHFDGMIYRRDIGRKALKYEKTTR